MKTLGIETSCDETAISLIEADGDFDTNFSYRVLGDMTRTQAIHADYGGVFPMMAKREHAENIVPILSAVLKEADITREVANEIPPEIIESVHKLLEREEGLSEKLIKYVSTHEKPEIDTIAVTAGPGLEPALWVGINTAKALSMLWNIPLVSSNHMEGHILISSLSKEAPQKLSFPAISLLISGGHTEIILSEKWMQYKKIGETRDDAVGEAFDKTARLLGFPYPGGPELSRRAAEHRALGAEDSINFPRPMLNTNDLDFSFSGLKTAVRIYLEKNPIQSEDDKNAIAHAFEDAVVEVLVSKVRKALSKNQAKTLIVGGGVSANAPIRTALKELIESEFPETNLMLSAPEQATDNALMIALSGHFHAIKDEHTQPNDIRAEGTRQLS